MRLRGWSSSVPHLNDGDSSRQTHFCGANAVGISCFGVAGVAVTLNAVGQFAALDVADFGEGMVAADPFADAAVVANAKAPEAAAAWVVMTDVVDAEAQAYCRWG